MRNLWRKMGKPIIGLAPMAGITDSPARIIAKEWGAEIVYSEMISSHGLVYPHTKIFGEGVYGDKKSFKLCQFRKKERPVIIQIFGRDPQIMAEAAEIIEQKVKADGVDINFGCPAKRVIKSGNGAALMDEPEIAAKIVSAVRKRTKIPLSVKTRLGKGNKNEILEFGRIMEDKGAEAIAIHGRTLKQGYQGSADWQPIFKVKKILKIPVIGNGDIKTKEDIAKKLCQNNLDGILIGRGAFGNPFIFEGVAIIKNDPQKFLGKRGFRFGEINKKEKIKTILKHAELVYEIKGERGLIEFRKHLAAYVRGEPKAKEIRQKLVKITTMEEIKEIFKSNL